MASRKLYDQLAPVLRDLGLAPSDREIVAAAVGTVLKQDNQNFDDARFRDACRPEEGAEPKAVDPETLTRILIDYITASYRQKMPSIDSILSVAQDSVTSMMEAEAEAKAGGGGA